MNSKGLLLIAIIALTGSAATACNIINAANDSVFDSVAWAQLKETEWGKGNLSLVFPENTGGPFTFNNGINSYFPQIQSVSGNKVSFLGGSFNYKISGSSLTVSNFSPTLDGTEMNGTYTKK